MALRKEENGTWRIDITIDGVRTTETVPASATRRQAEARHKIVEREHYDFVRLGIQPDIPIEQALMHYLKTCVKPEGRKWQDGWKNTEKQILRVAPYVKDRKLSEAVEVYKDVQQAFLDEKLAPATINAYCGILRRVVKASFKDWGWLREPLHLKFDNIGGATPKRTRLDNEADVELICSHLDPEVRRIVRIQFRLAMRPNEVWKIGRVYQVKFNPDVIIIPDLTQKNDDYGRIPFDSVVKAELLAGPIPLDFGPNSDDFQNYAYHWYYNRFKKAVKAAGFCTEKGKSITPHTLRKTALSLAVERGVSLPMVAHMGRHKTVQQVMDAYAISSDQGKRAAFEQAFGGRALTPEQEEQRRLRERIKELEAQLAQLRRGSNGDSAGV